MTDSRIIEGFYLMARGWLDHPTFDGRPYCQRAAWAWLIEEASYAGRRRSIKGRTVELRRGQLTASIRFIAKAWRWNRSAVERFLGRLKTETMIETATETGQLIITICNYERYQTRAAIAETAIETPVETEVRQERDKLERKERRKDISPPNFDDDGQFSAFWAECPRRVGKADAHKAFVRALKKPRATPEVLTAGMRRYRAETATTETKFIKHPASWLNGECWADEPASARPMPVVRKVTPLGVGG